MNPSALAALGLEVRRISETRENGRVDINVLVQCRDTKR